MMIFAIHQHESATDIHVFPPILGFLKKDVHQMAQAYDTHPHE